VSVAERWFASMGWKPFEYQREVWAAYARGESGLIHAATGTGKTLAAWMAVLDSTPPELPVTRKGADQLKRADKRKDSLVSANPRVSVQRQLQVLWITPLRALVADTLEALRQPANEIVPEWRIEARTGDTPSAVRAKQDRELPETLVTTPESLSLLISRETSHQSLGSVRAIVIDEWHELMGSKRGIQVELALARMRAMVPDVRIWGLSATIGNLDTALDALLAGAPGRIVRGDEPKTIVVDSLIPPVIERFPWAGHLGTQMLPQLVDAIEEGQTSIVFCNTRSQVEIWYQAILAARPDWAGLIALHHGSLDPDKRAWVEDGLRSGKLRCVVATSSLDLGVDFSPVDRVLQVGSPKGIARLLQRAGRSGHRPGAVSRVTCVPTNALELAEVAAARDGIAQGRIESRYAPDLSLDVLAQHLVTVALGGGFEPNAMLAEVRSTRAFRDLSDEEWDWLLAFLSSGGAALSGYEDQARIEKFGRRYIVTNDEVARRHRMSIGTIVSDSQIAVQYLRGPRLGTVEESFVARLRPGDRFVFGGKPLEFIRVRDMKAWVRRAPNAKGAIPRWMGSRLPLSGDLAAMLRERIGEASRGVYRDREMQSLAPLFEVQRKWSAIPAASQLLIERVKTRDGWHLFFYPFEGRLVHEGLAALCAWRLARLRPATFTMASNDHGFQLLSADEAPLQEALAAGLLSPLDVDTDITASLNAAEMARRQFREIARVAGLVFPGLPRSGKTARQLQASSTLFFEVFQKHDPGNLLVGQAFREVMERQLERTRLGRALRRLSESEIIIREPKRVTPFGFPLVVDINRDRVSSEKLSDRIKRMQLVLEKAAG
jgi:ATP-dependent helicase Lhr and Lhr-like helicase